MPAIVKRSASTPNVRGQAAVDAASAQSAADKRRNKLGYHRTGVACGMFLIKCSSAWNLSINESVGNCRRRKIRCLLAPDDAQHRCSNCIRLKKECNFFPVDQQTQPDRRHRATSKAENSLNGISTSTSPASTTSPALVGRNIDGTSSDAYSGYSSVPITPAFDHFTVPSRELPRNLSTTSSGPGTRVQSTSASRRPSLSRVQSAPFVPKVLEYNNNPISQSIGWETPTYVEQSPLDRSSGFEDPGSAYWRLTDSPQSNHPAQSYGMSGPYGPGDREPQSAPHHQQTHQDVNWPLPTTPLSIDHHQGINQSNAYPYGNNYSQDTSGPLYATTPTSNGPLTAPMQQGPPFHGAGQPTSSSFYMQPVWSQSFPGHRSQQEDPSSRTAFSHAGWHAEPSLPSYLGQVDEEPHGSHYSEEQASYYPEHAQSAV
jgi:Fungal Zn(2)-Cys(6) binuclear cluster domain